MRKRVLAVALMVVLAAWLAPGATGAHANGVPQLVKLTYLDGVSNFGPKDAEGVLEFSFAEAYVRVDLKNLVPQTGTNYEGWMIAPGGKSFYVGALPVSASGAGSYEGKLANLNSYDYNLFVVAARDADSPAGTIPAKKAIAGRFVVIGANDGTKAGDIRPGMLPDTGQEAGGGLPVRLAAILLTVALATAVAAVAIRIARQGRHA